MGIKLMHSGDKRSIGVTLSLSETGNTQMGFLSFKHFIFVFGLCLEWEKGG